MGKVSKRHLEVLTVNDLKDYCDKMDEPVSGTKSQLISRLQKAGLSYDDLLVEDLKDILDYEDLPLSGRKNDLVQRLSATRASAPRAASRPSHASSSRNPSNAVSARHLEVLTVDDLKDYCDKMDEPVSGTKSLLTSRLRDAGLTYEDLLVENLKDLLDYEGLPLYGRKKELIDRLCSRDPKPPPRPQPYGFERRSDSRDSKPPLLHPQAVHGHHLQLLPNYVLKDLSDFKQVPHGKSKAELVRRLLSAGITYHDLLHEDLVEISASLKLPVNRSKSQLIERLIHDLSPARAVPSQPNASLIDRPMSRGEYRNIMRRLGLLRDGDHVCHIIAAANGGADHGSNYTLASDRFNMAAGNRHDALMCYIAGINRAEAAVAVSQRLRGYNGPSARRLVYQGEEVFREMRHIQRRQDW